MNSARCLAIALAFALAPAALADNPCGISCLDYTDGSGTLSPDGGLTIDDYLFFFDLYAQGHPCADWDDGSGTQTPDGAVTIDDLLYVFGQTWCC